MVEPCLEGLTKLATYNAPETKKHFPDARIFLRILKPHSSAGESESV
jgi:hypothetical protein